MRIMRSSIYIDMEHPPLTTVVRDCDVVDSLEGVRESTKQKGALCLYDIFDAEGNTSIGQATLTAMRRWEPRKLAEHNMAIAYHWTATQLPRALGALAQSRPSPLDQEDCTNVLLQLAKHPNYTHQLVIMITKDLEMVQMQDGEIKDVVT